MKLIPILIACAAATSAYAAEPPSCSNKAVTEIVRELFWETKLQLSPVPTEKDVAAFKAYADYYLIDIVSSGYDAKLKRRSCSGDITHGRKPLIVRYTVQNTEANDGRFVVRADFSALPDYLAMALREIIVQSINKGP